MPGCTCGPRARNTTLPPPENCLELAGPLLEDPSTNVTRISAFGSAAWISRTCRLRNASNCATPLPCGLQLSWPSSHSLGTMKLNRPTFPADTAWLKALMSFGPVPPVAMSLLLHSVDWPDGSADHTPFNPSTLS